MNNKMSIKDKTINAHALLLHLTQLTVVDVVDVVVIVVVIVPQKEPYIFILR